QHPTPDEEFLRERAVLLRHRRVPPATERLPATRRLARGAVGHRHGADRRGGELRPAQGPLDGPHQISPPVVSDVARALLPAASALVPTLAFDAVSYPQNVARRVSPRQAPVPA